MPKSLSVHIKKNCPGDLALILGDLSQSENLSEIKTSFIWLTPNTATKYLMAILSPYKHFVTQLLIFFQHFSFFLVFSALVLKSYASSFEAMPYCDSSCHVLVCNVSVSEEDS